MKGGRGGTDEVPGGFIHQTCWLNSRGDVNDIRTADPGH